MLTASVTDKRLNWTVRLKTSNDTTYRRRRDKTGDV